MAMQIFIDQTWKAIRQTLRRERGRTTAAIAYVTKRLLELEGGDLLVCDASETAVRSGQTDPKVLLQYLRKGVRILSSRGLHAKAVARGRSAIVGSANASAASADGQLCELVAIFDDRRSVSLAKRQIGALASRSVLLDPVTLRRLIPQFRPNREKLNPRTRRSRPQRQTKARAWCLGTQFIEEPLTVEKARRRGTGSAEKSARGLLGRAWQKTYRIDSDVRWSGLAVERLLPGDEVFEIEEEKILKPPGVLIHKEPIDGGAGAVLFVSRESKLRGRQLKKVKQRIDRDTYTLLRQTSIRQLSFKQLRCAEVALGYLKLVVRRRNGGAKRSH